MAHLQPHVERPQYPAGVPSKFAPDGAVQAFPHHLSPFPLRSPLRLNAGAQRQTRSQQVRLFDHPPTSDELPHDNVRRPSHEESISKFEKALGAFDLEDEHAPPYKMTVRGFDPLEIGIGVRLDGRTPAETERLRSLRNRLADKLNIRHPIHDGYGFHLSVAYLLRHLTSEQNRELEALLLSRFEEMPRNFELGAPEFCTFENMFAFKRVLFLGGGSN
ncbi:hypothetical protein CGLO_11123 [Colletotrichum gloeosporioides Cg-14]|uniref:DUF1868 domain-containing protein n=1 Tax=Colletotrichum gloeosporioides (strain Cg-14) TaxID=1237896 RepID=T0LCU4_COLGC|nr:hypothetical protein CGLO_11123 [Colletotrichum gloeosporioides Cg-14]